MTARQLILDLLARDKTGPATRSSARNLKTVGDAAEEAAESSERLGTESEQAEDGVGQLGKSARTAAQHVEHLDREIESCERELRQMAVAFAQAESAAERADLSKAIRRTEGDLRRLNKSKIRVSELVEDKDTRGIGTKLVSGIGAGFASAAGPLKGAIGAALAPTIAGVAAAAIVGGVGVGGLLGGVALVAKDPSVSGYAKQIGQTWLAGVNAEAKDAFLGPTKQSLGQVEKFAATSVGKIGKIFDETAPFLEGFTADILHAGDALLDGFGAAASKSGPVLQSLGNIIADTGDSVGELLSTVADHSDEAAAALDDVNVALQDTISVIGTVIGLALELRGAIDTVDEFAHKWEFLGAAFDSIKTSLMGPLGMIGQIKKGIDGAGDAAEEAKPPTSDLGESTLYLAGAMSNAEKAALGQTTALEGLSKELKAQTDPTFALLRAQDDLRTSQKEATKALNEHGRKSPEYQEALRKSAEAALTLEAAAGKVASTSSGRLTPELIATLKAAGWTESKIRDLAGQFANAKKKGDDFAKKYAAWIAIKGMPVLDRAHALYQAFRDKKITVDVYVAQHRSNKVDHQLGRMEGRAVGGPVKKGQAYIVGERRPEVFVPESNGTIIPSVSSYASGAAGGGARPVEVRLVLDVRGADSEFGRLILKIFRTDPAAAQTLSRYLQAA